MTNDDSPHDSSPRSGLAPAEDEKILAPSRPSASYIFCPRSIRRLHLLVSAACSSRPPFCASLHLLRIAPSIQLPPPKIMAVRAQFENSNE